MQPKEAKRAKPDQKQSWTPLAQDFFARWGEEGVVDLKEELTELIILTASRTLLGALLPSRLPLHLHLKLPVPGVPALGCAGLGGGPSSCLHIQAACSSSWREVCTC